MIKITFVVAVSIMLMSGCLGSVSVHHPNDQVTTLKQPVTSSAEKLFLAYLNLDKMPDTISDFSGQGTDIFPVFLSSGYFSYQAELGYLDMLKRYDRFIEQSEFNQMIHPVDCAGPEFPNNFSGWTKDSFSTTGKTCLKGIFFPYIHYLIYDPQTGHVIHFVEGMRG